MNESGLNLVEKVWREGERGEGEKEGEREREFRGGGCMSTGWNQGEDDRVGEVGDEREEGLKRITERCDWSCRIHKDHLHGDS